MGKRKLIVSIFDLCCLRGFNRDLSFLRFSWICSLIMMFERVICVIMLVWIEIRGVDCELVFWSSIMMFQCSIMM